MTRLGVARALVGDDLVDGDVEVADGRIVATGLPGAGRGLAAPGFIDLQVNGFAGVDLVEAGDAGFATVGQALARTGVTAYQPTFITGDPDVVVRALEGLANRQGTAPGGPHLLGAHLEGPFLSPRRAGTHPVDRLREPDQRLQERYLAAGPVSMATLAPELPGGLAAIERLVAAGVTVAMGHTDADAEVAHAAVDAGARAATHLFNAMRPFAHRDPGVAAVALTRDEVTVGLIVDGVHLAADAVRLAWRAAGRRVVMVTDATAAAGMPDGMCRLGEVVLHKRGTEVRNADDTLAGSALTMDEAVRNAVDLGIDVAHVLYAASTAPARLVGETDRGSLHAGARADLVVLDDDLGVVRVLADGREIG